MNPDFLITGSGEIVFMPWIRKGIRHGFLSDKETTLPKDIQRFYALTQVHGDSIIEIDNDREMEGSGVVIVGKGDGLIAQAVLKAQTKSALLIKTADCLPCLMVSGNSFAAIHAGWRGLAQMIIPKAILQLTEHSGISEVEIVIGPCACSSCYEVQQDVIDDLGAVASYKRKKGNTSYYLDLPKTAGAQLVGLTGIACSIYCSDVCTIESQNYNSYRREGKLSGRNSAYIEN